MGSSRLRRDNFKDARHDSRPSFQIAETNRSRRHPPRRRLIVITAERAFASLPRPARPETERSFKHEETLDPGGLDSNPIIPVFVEIPASRGVRGDIHARRSISAGAVSQVETAKSILESSNEEFPANECSLLVPVYTAFGNHNLPSKHDTPVTTFLPACVENLIAANRDFNLANF
ncbi:hypothetical protein K0M31_000472 [Melipona bicolor]|uniref:Uncharacterized protein n=1 Tax=Melipona bicolor TaxID=60889 RepID=A0AA40GDU1_9HYME|nr:hypothetical protein K0M31_000472 [Melipona bicolor]